MAPPAVPVRRATLADRDAVVHALVRAFDADPVANFLLRQDGGRVRALETVFDVAFRRWTLPVAGAWIAEGGGGAALWTPPGEWKTWRAWPNVLGLAGAVGFARLRSSIAASNRVQREHPRDPHWYLFAIGVDPSHQGRGIGGALLAAQLAECRTRGEAAYLEASTENNARLYARHGFRVTKVMDMVQKGPTLRLMWRDAET
jgi:ribosomal protein S18 acetylase RimI-like enzyme